METLNTILFWVLVYILLWQAYILIFNKGIPNIRTAPAIRKALIERLKQDMRAKDKKPYTIIDLGSGNGLFTREIAAAIPEATVIGLEISKQQIAWANKMRDRKKLENLTYEHIDFFSYDLSQADAVVIYMIIHWMEDIGRKLNKELKPGTFVSSNRFRLRDGWEPIETLSVPSLYFHQKNVFLYRKD